MPTCIIKQTVTETLNVVLSEVYGVDHLICVIKAGQARER